MEQMRHGWPHLITVDKIRSTNGRKARGVKAERNAGEAQNAEQHCVHVYIDYLLH